MITFRKATIDDILTYFEWANEQLVRNQSYNSGIIDLASHSAWFENNLNDESSLLLIFSDVTSENIGQVRFQKDDNNTAIISISVAAKHRGQGRAGNMLTKASDYFFSENPGSRIEAYIKETNLGSIQSFERAGFLFEGRIDYQGDPSVYFSKVR